MSQSIEPITLPVTSGDLDLDYLAAALRRAGRSVPNGSLQTEQLLGGRTGATVQRLICGGQRFVLKFAHEHSWRVAGLGMQQGGEPRLWAHGTTRDLAGPISCPVIDVAREPTGDGFWILMDDVGSGIRDRGKFTRDDSRALIAGLAAMQAPHFDSPALRDAPLPPVSGPTGLFRAGVLHISGQQAVETPWIATMVDDFQVVGAFLPVFLETLGPQLADAYLALAADDSWLGMLDSEPETLLHGDLRRANMGFAGDAIQLFDWEFAARGPAGCDLQWHCLLHYWGYPPDGVVAGDDCDDLADFYVERLAAERGAPVDRAAFDRGWKLGWIKAMVQLGYVLIDPLYPDGGDAETRRRIADLSARAVRRAVEMRAALG